MTVEIIGPDRIRAAISFEELIDPIANAYRAMSDGRAVSDALVLYPQHDQMAGDIFVKTGVIVGSPVCVVKVAPWFAGNERRGEPQGGFIAVLDSATGHTIVWLDDQHYLSDIRTAAAGAVAANVFAPMSVETATIVGAGKQAYWQARALHSQRPFRRLHIWARDPQKAAMLREKLVADLPDTDIVVADELRSAIERAHVIITTTVARKPLIRGDWLRPGQHVTAVGADDPSKAELDGTALNRARVFVEERKTAAENGDIYRAARDQRYDVRKLAGEIGDVLLGRVEGRRSGDEITIAKLIGIGAMDVAAAQVTLAALGIRR